MKAYLILTGFFLIHAIIATMAKVELHLSWEWPIAAWSFFIATQAAYWLTVAVVYLIVIPLLPDNKDNQ